MMNAARKVMVRKSALGGALVGGAMLMGVAAHVPTVLAAETEPVPQNAADMSVRDIATELFKAKPGEAPDYSNHDLTYLDLSGLNFKGAKLAKSNFYGADFTGANLRGTDMSGTRLDRATLIRADFSGANLSGASILRPTIYSDLSENLADAPRFAGANLSGIRVMANLSGSDFHGADLSDANFTPREVRAGQGTITTLSKNLLKSCDFTKAIIRGGNFEHALMTFSRFNGADLTDANLRNTDLSRADFTGADLTGADLTGADLDGATLLGVKGLDKAKGLSTALNFDKTIR
ncbi:pentapeptide repeat-containing protein [Hyphomicrobium sp. NDB2Meth4]|uniref:pentapeptide repeat-containing protein n=1 Tax=Hyphomicrobium sp. NDB2Meth4 TaxID=1892846 RepID=UPI000A57217B|nr:pentapeptide repeat-containing protein [Hyphomicrobium sp. NDB2Meth4]